jgi:hypothetical protein
MNSIFSSIMDRYNASLSHCFCITGSGVQDMVQLGLMFNNYLKQMLLAGEWDLIVFFDPAHGIRFPDKEAERIAMSRAQAAGQPSRYVSMSLKAAQLLGWYRISLPGLAVDRPVPWQGQARTQRPTSHSLKILYRRLRQSIS